MAVINGFFGLGQSLMLQRNPSGTDVQLMRTPDHGAAWCWMPNSGVMPAGADVSGLVALDEGDTKQGIGAPLLSRLQWHLMEHVGSYQHMFWASATVDGSSMARRGRGSATWREFLRILERARDLFAAQGDTLVLRAIVLHDGEAESYAAGMNAQTFRDGRLNWVRWISEDARKVLGQEDEILFFPYVTGREPSSDNGTTLLARTQNPACAGSLLSEDADPRIIITGPSYPDPYEADDPTHPGPFGVCRMAEMEGDIIAPSVFGTYRKRAMRARWVRMVSSTVCRVTYWRPVAFAATDTVLDISALGDGLGWSAAYAEGGTSLALTADETSGDSHSVDLTFAAAPNAPFRLFNAGLQPTPDVDQEYSNCFSALREATPYVLAAESATGRDEYHWTVPEDFLVLPF